MDNPTKTILLVDDDEDYLFQTRLNIEQFGFRVISAESQHEAEKLLETLKPDLAILDLMMENEDSGFILAFRLKKMYPDVPVIIATAVTAETGMSFGVDSDEDRKWIRADLYIEKGIRADQLNREIIKLLKL
jgi:two-component system, OmpR family, response regulator